MPDARQRIERRTWRQCLGQVKGGHRAGLNLAAVPNLVAIITVITAIIFFRSITAIAAAIACRSSTSTRCS
jgi:hypothetical protein